MTYGQIFSEIYKKNKRYIVFCIALCMIFSVLWYGGNLAVRAEVSDPEGVAASLGGSFGESIAPIIATGYFGGIDTPWVMVILSVASLAMTAGKSLGIGAFAKLSGFSFGIFQNPYVAGLLLIWFGVPLVLKLFSATSTVGIAIEDSLKKFNGLLITVIAISQMISNVGSDNVVEAAGSKGVSLPGGINAFACFIILIVTVLLYFLMRYLFELIDIVMIPVCAFVPFVSAIMVAVKFVGIIVLFIIAVYLPVIFMIISSITVIVAILLFRTSYLAIRYFKSIYVKPLFKKIFGGYDINMPLVAKRMPKAVRDYVQGKDIRVLIPVYILKSVLNVKIRKWERMYLVCENDRQYLLKPLFGKNECTVTKLVNNPGQKLFINQFLTYHEIFNLACPEENLIKTFKKVPKLIHIVFSKEYYFRYQEIKGITGYTDLTEYKEILKSGKFTV